jgi:hypothetical protein
VFSFSHSMENIGVIETISERNTLRGSSGIYHGVSLWRRLSFAFSRTLYVRPRQERL